MINFKNVTLEYELHGDRTNNAKELLVNLFKKRKEDPVDRSRKFHKALDNLSLTFNDGERIGIIGHNGAGKSTFLKVLSGILKPSLGQVEVEGAIQPLIELGAGFDPEISGRENIYLNSYMLGFTKAQVQEKEEEIIEFTDIGKYIDVPVKYYSSGMLVRLAFTIATSIYPEILVIDEMLGAGDIHFLKKAEERLFALIDKARIVVIVSHDMGFVERMCNRCIILNSGNVVFDGPPKEGIQKFSSPS